MSTLEKRQETMKSRQIKALEVRDLITQVNARVAELREDGYKVEFIGKKFGIIKDVKITKTVVL